jgi:hypothetical protein
MKKTIVISVVFLIFVSGLYGAWKLFFLKSDKPPETIFNEAKDAISEAEEKIIEIEKEEPQKNEEKIKVGQKIPEKILLAAPFTSQAPFGFWDERHEEACEEASIIMLKYHLDKKQLSREIAEQEIQKVVDYQINKYGDYKDSNAAQMIKLARDFYGLDNLEAVYDFKKEDIKKELAKGSPVVIPADGRELGNPYYTAPGPLYHALVLVGYSGNQIITNDPGTRKGEGYRYDIDILYNAIHDFPGDKEKIKEGRKAMIVVKSGG